jgi:hypothetical protein
MDEFRSQTHAASDSTSATPSAASALTFSYNWPAGIWLNLLLSLFVGLVYVAVVLGPKPLDPRNAKWLLYDGSTYFIGWELFRQDPVLHWPLTFTERVGYPIGQAVAMMDLNSLLALILKPVSPLLPSPFQYLGIELVLECGLQFFFSVRLFRLLLGGNPAGVLLSSIFFLIAPPFDLRLGAHFALANHWLLLASLYLLLKTVSTPEVKVRDFSGYAVLLVFFAAAINPYLMCFVIALMAATIASLLWQRRMKWTGGVGLICGLTTTCAVVIVAIGLPLGGFSSSGNTGYRSFSMNLLAPVDPYPFHSILLPSIRTAGDDQIDGYNYLGLGVLTLCLILIPFIWSRRRTLRPAASHILPLALCCLILTLMAASTKVTLGPRLTVDLDPQQHLTNLFSPLRATGRFFWVPYYTILAALIVTTFRFFPQKIAMGLILVALAIQIADTSSLRSWMIGQTSLNFHPTPLKSSVWSSLGARHQNLIVLPAWQCDNVNTPGGFDGFRIFGFLAVQQRMRTNSYYSARYSTASLHYHCVDAFSDLSQKPLPRESVYVVSPQVATLIELGPSGPNTCHNVDGFILCSSTTNFGLPSLTFTQLPELNNSNRLVVRTDPKANSYLLAGWYFEPGGQWMWSNGNGVLAFVLTAQQRSQFMRVALHLRVLVGHESVKFAVRSTEAQIDDLIPGAPNPRVVTVDVRVPLRKGRLQAFEIKTQNPPRPVDIGMNSDSRKIGVGLEEAWLE